MYWEYYDEVKYAIHNQSCMVDTMVDVNYEKIMQEYVYDDVIRWSLGVSKVYVDLNTRLNKTLDYVKFMCT